MMRQVLGKSALVLALTVAFGVPAKATAIRFSSDNNFFSRLGGQYSNWNWNGDQNFNTDFFSSYNDFSWNNYTYGDWGQWFTNDHTTSVPEPAALGLLGAGLVGLGLVRRRKKRPTRK